MSARDQGSVFIDAMIAAAIVTLSLGTMYRAMADGASHDRMAEGRRMALLVAQSEMAAVGSLIPEVQGTTSGVEGPFAWQVDVEPFNTGFSASRAGAVWQVTVSVRPQSGAPDAVVLRNIQVGPAA
jgi:hypothetical protein